MIQVIQNNKVLYFKGACAFLVPFGTVFGAAFVTHSQFPGWWQFCGVVAAASVAGFSGLSSYLSRTFADHQDETKNEK
jgi:hypothetical protein